MVRGALSIGLIWASVYLLQHSNARSPLFYAIIVASAAVGFGLRRLGDWLRAWTDRRFFRDAYNAEQILSELAEKVRTIVETEPLLETVTQRIADALHVPRVAVLLNGSGRPYRTVHALGYGSLPNAIFAEDATTVEVLKKKDSLSASTSTIPTPGSIASRTSATKSGADWPNCIANSCCRSRRKTN